MTDDLHARLLAEIERREDHHRMAMMPPRITRPIEHRDVTAEMQAMARGDEALAYLEALRKVVELHRPFEAERGPICASCAVRKYPCASTVAIAETLGG